MDESARIVKNSDIKNSIRETLTRHASMRPLCVELKLDLKCLNRTEREKLWHSSRQCIRPSSVTWPPLLQSVRRQERRTAS